MVAEENGMARTYRLRAHNGLPAGLGAHAREGAEGVVCEDVDALYICMRTRRISIPRPFRSTERRRKHAYPVIRLEVVDLLPEHQRPQVLAEELDHIERIVEAWAVAREPVTPGLQSAINLLFPLDSLLHDSCA